MRALICQCCFLMGPMGTSKGVIEILCILGTGLPNIYGLQWPRSLHLLESSQGLHVCLLIHTMYYCTVTVFQGTFKPFTSPPTVCCMRHPLSLHTDHHSPEGGWGLTHPAQSTQVNLWTSFSRYIILPYRLLGL